MSSGPTTWPILGPPIAPSVVFTQWPGTTPAQPAPGISYSAPSKASKSTAPVFPTLFYGQFYGYPAAADYPSLAMVVMNPGDGTFTQVPTDTIKGIHGHLQHFASETVDDNFPYADLVTLSDNQVAAGGHPILATATYNGVSSPVYFADSLVLDSNNKPTADPTWWQRPVNTRDPAFINFYISNYARQNMIQGQPNYWIAPDNCTFWISSYGVLDSNGVFQSVSQFDQPFWQSDADLLNSIIYFLGQLKQLAPDILLEGNAGTMSDETQFSNVWGPNGLDGYTNEDIFNNFGSDSYSRSIVDLVFDRSQYLGSINKPGLLQFYLPPNTDPTYAAKVTTALMAWLIYWWPNAYFAPRVSDASSVGIPIADFGSMMLALGAPNAPAVRSSTEQLYWRQTEHGIVYLNWSGSAQTVTLPTGNYVDRSGRSAGALTIPDLSGDYALLPGTSSEPPVSGLTSQSVLWPISGPPVAPSAVLILPNLTVDGRCLPDQLPLPTPSPSPPPSPPLQAQAAGFTVLYFDQEPGHWDIGVGVDGHKWNAGLWWETVIPDASSFPIDSNGILTITDLTGSGTNLCTQFHGVSGGPAPSGGTYFLGGYFEAYMSTTNWSAFWLFCADRPWVFGSGVLAGDPTTWTNEIDIIETDPAPAQANTVVTTLHSNSSGDTIPDQINANNNNIILNGPVEGKWHKYGLLWTKSEVTWYVDDVEVATTAPFASTWQAVQLILTAAPGGVNGGPSTVSPSITKVQWVRVWVASGFTPPVVTPPPPLLQARLARSRPKEAKE